MKITDYTLHRLLLPLREPIGDSQVRFEDHWMTVLELHTDIGHTGVGFALQQGMPTSCLSDQIEQFEFGTWPGLKDRHPLGIAQRISRPRGGNVGVSFFALPVETALWDLVGKQQQLTLAQVFGGEKAKVPAYGSTLDFPLDDETFRKKLEQFYDMGFRAVKTKVGHQDIKWDLKRLQIVKDVMLYDVTLMVDANEAWSVKETLIRVNRYQDAGHPLFWLEDPITREDYDGYRTLCAELETTRINTGEYLSFHGKRRLLEHQGVDVLNVHGSFGVSRAAAVLAADYGVPLSLGNTILEVGVHIAASLPECHFLEFSDLRWNELAVKPVQVAEGYAHVPDQPGHGLELDRDKLKFYARP
ncbi:MAG: mandelate racemase/muconate lactonizing enzyme family protein [Planctomycetaceae bacterium]